MPGTLYLPKPIATRGITLRALRVLKECDVVAAEDKAPLGTLAETFPFPSHCSAIFIQRSQTQRGNHRTPPGGREGRAGHGRGQSRHQRSGRARGEGGDAAGFRSSRWLGRARWWRAHGERVAGGRIAYVGFCRHKSASAGTSWNPENPSRHAVFYDRRIASKNCWANSTRFFPTQIVLAAS